MLKDAFERSLNKYGDTARKQIESIRNIAPIGIWKYNVDLSPHIVVDVIWDSLKVKEHSTAYSDLLDLKKYTEYGYSRLVAPIMLDGEDEIAPVIAPKFEVEESDIVNRIKGAIENRLEEVSGSVKIEKKMDIEAFIRNTPMYSDADKLKHKNIIYTKIGGVTVNDLKEYLNDYINRADIRINAPIELAISGKYRETEEVQRKRDLEYQIALMLGYNPQYSSKIDLMSNCYDLADFTKEFNAIKDRVLRV